MSDREQLIAAIKERAIVPGKVTLASGREADYYVDLRRVTLDGAAAPLVGRVMRALVADWEIEAVGGLTLGADPVAVAMLHAAAEAGQRLDAFVVRKTEKAHGLHKKIEGAEVAGRRVLVVEDTSTTGGSVQQAIDAVQAAGGVIVGVAVILDRDTGAREKIEAQGLAYRAAVALADLSLA
ncbi:MAG: orotate phosphoribosyltransferase [Propionibacteriaceae bacterium]|jgi:orotate phosphoribosyltransferase|nr:orotate phosphoribosyltransferase [Propionibacteriaceae bacterium]